MPRTAFLLSLPMALLVSGAAMRAQVPPLPDLGIPDGFGVNIHFTSAGADELRALGESGARFVRMDFSWGRVERAKGEYDRNSSGSSAGSASSTAAGLVGFSLGTETLGSIVSPSSACGTVGLRPTYGRVSRHGAMALSWTLDKLGPMCRSADCCGIVLGVIAGRNGLEELSMGMSADWPLAVQLGATLVRVGSAIFGART